MIIHNSLKNQEQYNTFKIKVGIVSSQRMFIIEPHVTNEEEARFDSGDVEL